MKKITLYPSCLKMRKLWQRILGIGCFILSMLCAVPLFAQPAPNATSPHKSAEPPVQETVATHAAVKSVFAPSASTPTNNAETAPAPVVPQPQSSVPYNQATAPANGTLTPDHPVYTLQLNSNPTTGYSWFLVSYPSDLLSITKHEYIPPKTNMAGAGGYEIWVFTAKPEAFVAPRALKIQMVYARPWEVNDQMTAQTF